MAGKRIQVVVLVPSADPLLRVFFGNARMLLARPPDLVSSADEDAILDQCGSVPHIDKSRWILIRSARCQSSRNIDESEGQVRLRMH